MEIVTVKFTRPQHVSGMATYQAGEIAGFSRQLADRIVKAGAAQYHEKSRPTKRGVQKKDMSAADDSTYETK